MNLFAIFCCCKLSVCLFVLSSLLWFMFKIAKIPVVRFDRSRTKKRSTQQRTRRLSSVFCLFLEMSMRNWPQSVCVCARERACKTEENPNNRESITFFLFKLCVSLPSTAYHSFITQILKRRAFPLLNVMLVTQNQRRIFIKFILFRKSVVMAWLISFSFSLSLLLGVYQHQRACLL